MADYEVAVIGAGISGLGAIKCFLDRQLSVICLEKSEDIGGLWNFSECGYGVMRFTHINVSKQNYVFSDFPFPEETPDFPNHTDMLKYLKRYCEHFDLIRHISFNCIVMDIKQLDSGMWKISFNKGKFQDRATGQEIVVRNVAIATGHHSSPYMPSIPGQERYTGHLFHSVKYKCAASSGVSTSSKVLIVGMGNSSVDIADNLVTQGQCRVDISARSPSWVFPPFMLGCPVDHYAVRALYKLPLAFIEAIVQTMVCMVLGVPRKWGIFPVSSILRTQPTVSHTLYHHIQRGYVRIRGGIDELGEGKKVKFKDGSTENYDCVILATGYSLGLPFLNKLHRREILTGNNEVRLYKNVFSPKFGSSLGFIGFVQPASGGLLTMSELQSRWMAELISGKVRLPPAVCMEDAIDKEQVWRESWYHKSRRHTIQQIPILYNDEISEMIGCKPALSWSDLTLTWTILFSVSAFQWRLNGPLAWNGARQYCKTLKPVPFFQYTMLVVCATMGILLLSAILQILSYFL